MERVIGNKNEYRGFLSIILTVISIIIVIFPNFIALSTDELAIQSHSDPLAVLMLDQASNGRYTFAAILKFLSVFHVHYEEYIVLSSAFLVFSLVLLLQFLADYVKFDETERVCFSVLFVFFPLNLDVYQFKEAYLSYAVSFLFLALYFKVFSVSIQSKWKFLLGSVCLLVSFGSYQISIILALMAFLIKVTNSGNEEITYKDVYPILVASILYSVVNALLKKCHVPGFEMYPAREQGLRFVSGNLWNYANASADIFIAGHGCYYPLILNSAKLIFLFSFVVFILNFRTMGAALFVVAAVVLAANPLNLMIKGWWPSARSISAIAFSLPYIMVKNLNVPFRNMTNASRFLFCAFFSIFFFTDMWAESNRVIQSYFDISRVNSIISSIYAEDENYSDKIILYIQPDYAKNHYIAHSTYDYGTGLLQTPWSATAVFNFLSQGKIEAHIDESHFCEMNSKKKFINKGRDNTFYLCF